MGDFSDDDSQEDVTLPRDPPPPAVFRHALLLAAPRPATTTTTNHGDGAARPQETPIETTRPASSMPLAMFTEDETDEEPEHSEEPEPSDHTDESPAAVPGHSTDPIDRPHVEVTTDQSQDETPATKPVDPEADHGAPSRVLRQWLQRQGKHPSFLKLLTTNYDTKDLEQEEEPGADDKEEGNDEASRLGSGSNPGAPPSSVSLSLQDTMTFDVDVLLGLKQPSNESMRIRSNEVIRRSVQARSRSIHEGYYEGSLRLALPEDAQYLSDLHCWIRRSLELFSATPNDVAHRPSLVVSRVGLRCVYCRAAHEQTLHKETRTLPPGAVSYPTSLAAILTICQQKPQTHWESCPNLPDEERNVLLSLLEDSASSKRQRRDLSTSSYYLVSAKRLGLVNHDSLGIRFGRDLSLSPLSLEMCKKQFESLASDPTMTSATVVASTEPRITASPEAEAVLADALLEPDKPEENLSRSVDKANVTDFFFLLIRQMRLCHVLPMDFQARGKRAQGLRLGLAGFCCRHCGDHDPPSSCRCFTSAADNLSSSISSSFAMHLLKCPRAPVELKKALQAYKKLHPRQLAQLPYGSQRRTIHELWTRMREADIAEDDMKEKMEVLTDACLLPTGEPDTVSSEPPNPTTGKRQGRHRYNETALAGLSKYPEGFPSSTDEATRSILKQAEQDWPSDPSEENLILPSERFLVSEFLYLAMRQLVVAQPSSDGRGRRLAGIQCRHCQNQTQLVSPSGRSFPTAPDNFASAINSSLNQHFQSCTFISTELKAALSTVRKLHSVQCSSLQFGAQRRFFNILFDRLAQLTILELETPPPGLSSLKVENDIGVNGMSHSEDLAMLLSKHEFMQIGKYYFCKRCRMVPWHFRSEGSMFCRPPTGDELKAHTCKQDSFDFLLLENELIAAIESDFDGQLDVLSSDEFKHVLKLGVGGCPELYEIVLEMCACLQRGGSLNSSPISSKGLWNAFPSSVKFESLVDAFKQLSSVASSGNMSECPRFLQFLLLIAPGLNNYDARS